MLRGVIHKRLICGAFFPFTSSTDHSSNETSIEIPKYKATLNTIKGYLYDNQGYPIKEVQSVFNTTITGTIVGFFLGGIAKAKDVPATYKTQNQATLYENKFIAYREIQHKVTMNIIKGGILFGIRIGLFCFLFSSISSSLYVYRGKFDILNSICSGAITGFIFKINMGLKGAFAGTVLGTILGTIYGGITWLLLFATGTEMNELYEAGSKMMNARRDKIKEMSRHLLSTEKSEIVEMYERNREMKHALEEEKDKKKV